MKLGNKEISTINKVDYLMSFMTPLFPKKYLLDLICQGNLIG